MDSAKTAVARSYWNGIPIVGLLGLLAWQAWLTLSLFGAHEDWDRLLDDQPVLSGHHPLHQYHGYLGAQSLLYRGCWCCYDPAFQSGYPKTPIFDSGSRFAELSMLVAGGEFSPAAYKVGLAILIFWVPLLLLIGARGVGLNWWETWLAVFLAQLVAWGAPARAMIESGEMDIFIAAIVLLAELGLLIRYDRDPGFFCWFGLILFGVCGWFAHPLLFGLSVPLVLIYYLSAGVRHRVLLWHVGLWSSQAAALAINAPWLCDWVRHWWIRTPPPPSLTTLPHRTFRTVWESSLWGTPTDRLCAACLVVCGLLGLVLFNRRKKQRATARLFGLAAATLLVLALLGISWAEMGRIGTAELLAPALWFLTIPAARAVVKTGRWLARLEVLPALRFGLIGATLLVIGLFGKDSFEVLAQRGTAAEPLVLGLDTNQKELVRLLQENATGATRILWEDEPSPRTDPHWTALLPLLTGRSFIGGLDADGPIDHCRAGLAHAVLAGRELTAWTDGALQSYCQRYNVGWIVARSPAALDRFRAWKDAEALPATRAGGEHCLFRVQRDHTGFALHGRADLVSADGQRLVLANVVPQDGKVVLSFHYQAGMRAVPGRVRIEREPDPDLRDPIDLLRLRVDAPVSRLVLTWDEP